MTNRLDNLIQIHLCRGMVTRVESSLELFMYNVIDHDVLALRTPTEIETTLLEKRVALSNTDGEQRAVMSARVDDPVHVIIEVEGGQIKAASSEFFLTHRTIGDNE